MNKIPNLQNPQTNLIFEPSNSHRAIKFSGREKMAAEESRELNLTNFNYHNKDSNRYKHEI